MGLFVQLFQRIPNTILFMQIRFVFIFIYEYDICPLFDSSFFSLSLSLSRSTMSAAHYRN